MKTLTKIMLLALLVTSILFTACSSGAPSVSKSQYDALNQEVLDAEATVTRLQAENTQLTNELEALKGRRDALQRIADGQK